MTFLRLYSAAPVWDELREALAIDPQRRRPPLMWQRHSRHPWLCSCREKSMGRLFRSIVRSSLNIRIRWRPPSAHQVGTKLLRSCGCWTRDWRAPALPQVGTITVLNCVMAVGLLLRPHGHRSSVASQSVSPWRAPCPLCGLKSPPTVLN